MYGSGMTNTSPNCWLNLPAMSRVISRCCFWSCPTGTSVGEVDEDVGRLEHRVGEQAMVGCHALGDLVLVADGPLEHAHGGDAGEDPGEFGDLGYVLLGEKGRLLRIESERQEVESHSLSCIREGEPASCTDVSAW